MRLALLGFLTVALSACSTPKVMKEPTILAPVESSVTLKKNWQFKTESMPNKDSEGLFFAEDSTYVYAASTQGHLVSLLKSEQGRWMDQVAWQTKFASQIVSGPAKSGNQLIIGTAKGQVFSVAADTGQIGWQTQLSSEVMSHAVISDQKVFTRTVDGNVYALSLKTGEIVWTAAHQMPSLSLRGSPPVVVYDNTLFIGWDSGTIQALSAKSGALLWETRVAVPKGRTDLERMVDVQAGLVIKQDRLFALGYHGKLVSIDPRTGNFYFVNEVSGYRDLAVDDSHLYVVDDRDILHAFDLVSGAPVWKQTAFKGRLVGDLLLSQGELLVVDAWGYLHWVNPIQGIESSRFKHSNEYGDGNRILRIKAEGNTLTVLDDEGVIT
ncbi:MAG: outer membrane protein assembly factor BamB, partial [Gammaproteobacteria bacterium]|nr:outer membrane protein assembly factor BamB [Gammaproteobacteria bacterium]